MIERLNLATYCIKTYFYFLDKKSPSFKKNGTAGKGKNIVTKHDAVICGRRNASKLMEVIISFDIKGCNGQDCMASLIMLDKKKVDIVGIIDHHYLSFLFVNLKIEI